MMQEFAQHIASENGEPYDVVKQRLRYDCHHHQLTSRLTWPCDRCMAHVINLATQALLAVHSKSKHFDPTTPNTDLLVMQHGFDRDEVGLVRTIVVKDRSSAPRKELFQWVQM
ncbi:hypothetical protein JVT61DRAFT_6243 [Boletus reticuloceps]|uniref:Uncharacterized protein n=1 Tax=Boletus reticuloceps TaxID=495285 RepID=A0A8I2YJN9_9AGAM|nr:hypothetical protein JVT61DRAFT_6243 [Boletus reticuloceps]